MCCMTCAEQKGFSFNDWDWIPQPKHVNRSLTAIRIASHCLKKTTKKSLQPVSEEVSGERMAYNGQS